MFVRSQMRESQEMVFDAHDWAFAFFKGTCGRGILDNMKTAVKAVFGGKEGHYDRRVPQMCSHFQVDPVACTPASGRRKGQVENLAGLVRERFFTPRLRVRSREERNAWLRDNCVAHAKAHSHSEATDKTIRDVFEVKRLQPVPDAGPIVGLHSVTASVSQTCTVRFDSDEDPELIRRINSLRNRYPVVVTAVGRPVEAHAHADRIVIRHDGAVVGGHVRAFGRNRTVHDPCHYVPVLARKPGALRHGVPFRNWVLPPAMTTIRCKLKGREDGDRQTIQILNGVRDDGLMNVEAA